LWPALVWWFTNLAAAFHAYAWTEKELMKFLQSPFDRLMSLQASDLMGASKVNMYRARGWSVINT
jgi:hypothetical protein